MHDVGRCIFGVFAHGSPMISMSKVCAVVQHWSLALFYFATFFFGGGYVLVYVPASLPASTVWLNLVAGLFVDLRHCFDITLEQWSKLLSSLAPLAALWQHSTAWTEVQDRCAHVDVHATWFLVRVEAKTWSSWGVLRPLRFVLGSLTAVVTWRVESCHSVSFLASYVLSYQARMEGNPVSSIVFCCCGCFINLYTEYFERLSSTAFIEVWHSDGKWVEGSKEEPWQTPAGGDLGHWLEECSLWSKRRVCTSESGRSLAAILA